MTVRHNLAHLHELSTRQTLNLKQAAKFLGIDSETLRRRAAAGTAPGAKIGKTWRFLEEDLVTYLRSFYSESTSQGVSHRRKTIWHSTKEKTSTGLILGSTEKEYREALELTTN